MQTQDSRDDGFDKQMEPHLQEIVNTTVVENGERYFASVVSQKEALLYTRRKQLKGFNERLYTRWAEALDIFELSLIVASECGKEFNQQYRSITAQNDYQFEALSRLHGSALLVAGEVYQLLLGGFASGAHGRWRTLYEIAIVMLFISRQPPSTAEAFLLHRHVKSYQDALQYNKHRKQLGLSEIDERVLKQLRDTKDGLVTRFGNDFADDYGWANAAMRKLEPTRSGYVGLKQLEKAVGTEFWAPYYSLSNHAIHAMSKSLSFNLGSMSGDMILAGPSNAGLADPGNGALVSLANATSALMRCAVRMTGGGVSQEDAVSVYGPAIELMAKIKGLSALTEVAGQYFLQAHKELKKQEKQQRDGTV